MAKSLTPTLDKFSLHPFGGRCTCFSHPYSVCRICKAAKEQCARWKALSKEDASAAHAEMELAYPPSSNQDGR